MLRIATLVIAIAHARASSAQGVSPPPFVLQSSDGDNMIQVGGLLQLDGRFALRDSAGSVVDTFLIRRFRSNLHGRLLRHFEFDFNPDFAGGTLVVQDAYIDTVFSKAFRLRLGKFKTPLGLERLIPANSLVFIERGFPTWVLPNRDVGVQVLGDLAGDAISYMAAVVNGAADFSSTDTDTNDSKEVALRVVVRPMARRSKSTLHGLSIGIAGGTGVVTELPSLKTATLFQTFFSYAGTATAEGNRVRLTPQASYYYKSLGAIAEFARSVQTIRNDEVSADIAHHAWQVAAAYVLTGEPASDHVVQPRHNFDFGGGHVGAIQVAARYHAIEVDQAAISLGLATPGSSRRANAFTVGVNWFLNPFVKYALNFERTVFDGDPHGLRPPEHALAFEAQVSF
ncbi:MAG TPA: porin [Vicinamibacterales bacterium]|nr:porin [Vicinamibacterales bacterium]